MSTGYSTVACALLSPPFFVFCLLVAHKFCGNCVAAGEIMAKALAAASGLGGGATGVE